MIVVNEPETSLHPHLLPALAPLIVRASRESQIVVVTHSDALVSALAADETRRLIFLEKELGETLVRGGDEPAWTWPTR